MKTQMNTKVDSHTLAAIEKLLHEIIDEDPRLKLSEDEDALADASSTLPGESVIDIYQSHLNPHHDQADAD
jgi:hypothetical protein